VKNPIFKNSDFDYIMFVDTETYRAQKIILDRSHWEVIVIDSKIEGKLQAKEIKINPEKFLKEYDFSIYIDGSFSQINDANLLVESSRYTYQMCSHPRRNCLYEEAAVCHKQGLDDTSVIGRQINKYKNDGYPTSNGLCMGGIIARKHNRKTKRINQAWWCEIQKGSIRDQLSINYVLWKLNENIGISDYEESVKNIFRIHQHTPKT